MCGICGIYQFGGRTPERAAIDAMTATMVHRGPDAGGARVSGRCALGSRRLSIVDVARGDMPLSNETDTIWVVHNGEIYNAPDLRKDLEAMGHRFRTHADTEVLVHGYEAWGDGVVERLNGMFAFALYDEPRERLLIARDRLGIKPLVFAERDGAFIFASEIKALRAHPAVEGLLHRQSLSDYLSYGYIPAPWTIFQGIWKLEPGRRLVIRPSGVRQEIYWEPQLLPRRNLRGIEEEFRATLRQSVRRHLMSDVPLGVFLSGGLDSASIVACLRDIDVSPIRTFTIGFEGEEDGDRSAASLVAERFDTDHRELILPPPGIECLARIVGHFDEPFADPSTIPTEAISRFAGQSVKVALSGDGGDELFGGYDWYTRQTLMRPFRWLRWFKPLAGLLGSASGFRRRGAVGRLQRLLYDASLPFERSFLRTAITFRPEDKIWLLDPKILPALGDLDAYFHLGRWFSRTQVEHAARWHDVERMLYADLRHYLPGSCLAKVDGASMMRSIEVRVPFLDREMVEFALSLPAHVKVRGLTTKWLVRKAMADRLPAELVNAPKKGFGMPLEPWFRGALAPVAEGRLLDPSSPLARLVQPERLRWMWTAHQEGRRDYGQHLWKLLILGIWLEKARVSSDIPESEAIELPPAVAFMG
ncbi:MAG: asparagine synthase (glutamine-hydrolyzing) [Planctomycetes bacterium]|nr:asparagine synthase (glutamine-hydrolyzing) [Planctomycetota bacterium]